MNISRVLLYVIPVALLLVARFALPTLICDDAYITFRVAENTVSGSGMVFNPGENTYVSTTPAWVLLVALTSAVSGDVVLAGKILGAIFESLLLLSLVHFTLRLRLGAASGIFASLLLITNPMFVFTSFSGMELPLYLFVLVVTSLFLSTRKFTWALALGAFALWVRFDGVVLLGATVLVSLWLQRAELKKAPGRFLVQSAPAAALTAAYIAFGLAFFETWIPMSVQRKALTSAAWFSPEWFSAMGVILAEFAKAPVGMSEYWRTNHPGFWVMILPLAVGARTLVSRRDASLVPLLALSAAYMGGFLVSGSSYAQYFPWYFAPILPAIYLLCGLGLARTTAALAGRIPARSPERTQATLGALLALGWLSFSVGPLRDDARRLEGRWREREHVYATGAVWAGKQFGNTVTVAANEIGAAGFFLPSEASMLDMFGILSRKKDLGASYKLRILEERPQVILTRSMYAYKEGINQEMPGAYEWVTFRALEIGVRSDLAERAEPLLNDLGPIFETLRAGREYNWDSHWKFNHPPLGGTSASPPGS